MDIHTSSRRISSSHGRRQLRAVGVVAFCCSLGLQLVTATASSNSFGVGHDDHSFAISHDNSLFTASNNNINNAANPASIGRRLPVSEARLWLDTDDDDDDNDDANDLMDTTIYSTTTHALLTENSNLIPTLSPSISRIRLPLPLQKNDLLQLQPSKPAWTEQSIQHLENRLLSSQSFGQSKQQHQNRLLKTGTTIAGVCGYDRITGKPFCVLGADTRATAGRMVADKRCQKIHCLARNLWACGAGTSADLDQVTRQCRYTLALQSLTMHDGTRRSSIGNAHGRVAWPADEEPDRNSHLESTALHTTSMATACRYLRNVLYEAGGSTGANLIVGGVDEGTGVPHIRAIHPHGSMDRLPYAALGSGGLAAMAIIESRFQPNNMTLEEGIQVVKEAIFSGIQNDMGSGSQVDLCTITTTTDDSEEGEPFQRVVSTYTRAVVPEQELAALEQPSITAPSPTTSSDNKTSSMSTPGVNGFGSHPYVVRSRQLILPSRNQEEQDRLQEWNVFLGYEPQQQDEVPSNE